MKIVLKLILCIAVGFAVGCTTTKKITAPDGTVTEQKVYDPIKTERVEKAVSGPIQSGIHYILTKKKDKAPQIAAYIGDARNIFCKMVETKQFSHEFLIAEADKLGTPALVKALKDTGDDDLALLVLSGKSMIIGLYDSILADKGTIELSDEGWGYQVAKVFCDNLSQALKDEGY